MFGQEHFPMLIWKHGTHFRLKSVTTLNFQPSEIRQKRTSLIFLTIIHSPRFLFVIVVLYTSSILFNDSCDALLHWPVGLDRQRLNQRRSNANQKLKHSSQWNKISGQYHRRQQSASFETIVGQWMLDATGDKFDKKRFRAIKCSSRSHALVNIMHNWHKDLDERHDRVMYIDFVKIFNHVDHPTVMKKLATLGTPPIIICWIHSLLMDCHWIKIAMLWLDQSKWRHATGNLP